MDKPILLLAMFVIAGCATPTSGPTIITRGPTPLADYAKVEQLIRDRLRTTLKDPDSIKDFRVLSGPIPASWYRGLINGGGHSEGWVYCYQLNAKNSYGAYVGLKTDGAVFTASYPDGRDLTLLGSINEAGITDTRC